jgi:hypothetical protein
MEDNEQLELQKEAPVDEQIDFDGWYASREDAIPAQHRKEILLADFRARKVPMVARIKDFDEALRKYGVKLG